MLLPAVLRAKGRGHEISCANNLRQLTIAWVAYADDNSDRLAYNLGASEIKQMLSRGEHYNWANSVLNWELDPSNTNKALNADASLGLYLSGDSRSFRCPSDRVLSGLQRSAGWWERSRTYSMNAMAGDAGEFTRSGSNVNNPSYRQFLKLAEMRETAGIFVFIEEHPDSINDGYFLNKAYYWEWLELPASYHNRGANLAYADGHVEYRRWQCESTFKPARPDVLPESPIELRQEDRADFNWLMARMSTH